MTTMTTTTDTIARNLRDHMAHQGRTTEQLAQLLDIPADAAARKSLGADPLTIAELFTVAGWLTVPAEELARTV